jgi:hypothetical protein
MILSNLPTIGSSGLLVAMGKVFFTEFVLFVGGALVALDPTSNTLTDMIPVPNPATSLTFDGSRIFGPDGSGSGSVTIVTLTPMFQNATVATVTTGFTQPWGTVFDGASGAILQTVTVGRAPSVPAFDGTNIWVPNSSYLSNSVSVVRASSGAVLATLTGNGIASPASAAFDGERILLTNQFDGTVSLFKAADLTPLGSVSTGGGFPYGACSDGVNFWVTLQTANRIVRF